MNYPLLALDAASGRSYACLLLSDDEALFAESEESRGHSKSLMPMLESLLERGSIHWKDLKMLGLGIGPGSFTGLRIAAAALAGINASLQLPVLPVSSLAVTAARADHDGDVWVLEDARAGEVFVGHYRQGRPVEENACSTWESTGAIVPSFYISESEPPVGLVGWAKLEAVTGRAEALVKVIRIAMNEVQPEQLPIYPQPVYLQISQAEKTLLAKERAA
ncbi:MAG TPA: tRNA (adenosine(37)-N6)-threonylcarbamoyltransferase complex dimerization subunit type 1 TsaB [Mariprofundaceae bacterium]|nr:tRNA (adenosine(37)-N6)-threonylcarbamoyltransferase complex dimerization subunit type 1 TsaB [Mariprofundaceae bacterium]